MAVETDAARVDGVSIRVDDVEQIARSLKIDRNTALERLIGEQLLIQEAKRRGLNEVADVDRVARQAAVQLLLERDVESATVSDEAIAEAYEAQPSRFVTPDRRASSHVLVSIDREQSREREGAAQQVAKQILTELRAAADPKEVWERYRGVAELDGFTIKAEDIPAAARTDAYALEYLAGLFSRSDPGVVERSVRTDFGWHAIIVTAILPGETTTLEGARETLRKELLVKLREQTLERLATTLMKNHRVEYDPPTLDGLLHADAQALGITAR